MPRSRFAALMFALASALFSPFCELQAQAVGPKQEDLARAREKAINFLKTTQAKEGYWTSADAPGVSGLITYSLLASGVPKTDPVVDKALKHLLSFTQPDGGIYNPKTSHKNYETSITLLALEAANQDGSYTATIKKAEKLIRQIQWDDSESTEQSDVKYGGQGYGRSNDRPDLSNTVFFVDALLAAGASKDDPSIQKAIVFISRCQNLETPSNNTPFAAKINDGGFYYTPAAGGSSPAGKTPEGGLRSYGSMTYAGLKSMVHAGLTPQDPRVKAATTWIQKFYSVQENPGLDQQGVFYYQMMLAKAFTAMEQDFAVDGSGTRHDWRKELAEELFGRQQENGAWVNSKNERWYEGNPDLATAYGLIALKYCEPKSSVASK